MCSKRLTLRGETYSEQSPPRSRRPDGQEETRGERKTQAIPCLLSSSSRSSAGKGQASETNPSWTPPPLTLTHKQVRSDGVKQRDGEITGEDDKHREKVRKEKSEEDCVCASAWNKPDGSCQLLSDERAEEELQREIARREERDEEMTAWAQVRNIEAGEETWTNTKGGTEKGMRGGRDSISYSTGTTTYSRYTQQSRLSETICALCVCVWQHAMESHYFHLNIKSKRRRGKAGS